MVWIKRLSLLLVLAAVWVAPASAADPVTIRIGTPDQSAGPTPSGGIGIVTYLAGKQLFEQEFAKDGIRIEWTFFKGAGPAVNEALANKQLDVVYLGDLAAIIGRANGLATRFLVPVRGNNAYLAVALGSDIKRLEDLKGKRLTVFKGTAYQLVLDRALAKVGLTERDLQVLNLDWSAASAALAAKQLDANWAGLQAVTLQEKGLARIALSARDLGREYTVQSGLLAREEFINDHPEVVQRIVNVLVKAQLHLSQPEHLDEFIGFASQRSGIPATLGQTEYGGEDLKFRFSPLIDEFVVEGFRAAVAQAKELGLVRKSFEVEPWFEPKFVDKAVADLELQGTWPRYDRQGQPQQR
jgi:sulfonate transport system substrate-binding protein